MFSLTAHDEPLNVCWKSRNLVFQDFFVSLHPEIKIKELKELKKLPLRSEVTARAMLFTPTEPKGVSISKVSSNEQTLSCLP